MIIMIQNFVVSDVTSDQICESSLTTTVRVTMVILKTVTIAHTICHDEGQNTKTYRNIHI